MNREEPPVDMKPLKPRFQPNIQMGQAVNFVALCGLIWTVSSGLGQLVHGQATQMASMKEQLIQLQSDRAKYVPMIEAVHNANSLQDQRIQNIFEAVQDIRTSNTAAILSVTTSVNALRDDMATVKAQLNTMINTNPVQRR